MDSTTAMMQNCAYRSATSSLSHGAVRLVHCIASYIRERDRGKTKNKFGGARQRAGVIGVPFQQQKIGRDGAAAPATSGECIVRGVRIPCQARPSFQKHTHTHMNMQPARHYDQYQQPFQASSRIAHPVLQLGSDPHGRNNGRGRL